MSVILECDSSSEPAAKKRRTEETSRQENITIQSTLDFDPDREINLDMTSASDSSDSNEELEDDDIISSAHNKSSKNKKERLDSPYLSLMNCIALCMLSRAAVCRGDHPPSRLVCSMATGANVSVMVLQGCKSSPQKSRPLVSGHRRHAVCIAIEYSYKLDQKNEFKFLCELCTFSHIRSHFMLKKHYMVVQRLYGASRVIYFIYQYLVC